MEEISASDDLDGDTKTKAAGLFENISSFDFIFCIMFLKNVMWKTKMMVDSLQDENLDVTAAESMMADTLKQLENIRRDEEAMNAEIDAAAAYSSTLGIDAQADFHRLHMKRVRRSAYSDCSEDSMHLFYRREINVFLDTTIRILREKVSALKSAFQPFIDALHPENKPSIEHILKLQKLFPEEVPSPQALLSELELFFTFYKKRCEKEKIKMSIHSAAKISVASNSKYTLFPLAAKIYKL